MYPASYSCSGYLPMPSSNSFAWETASDYLSHYCMQPSYQLEEPCEVCAHCSSPVSVNTYSAHHHQTTDYYSPLSKLQLNPPPSPASVSPLTQLPYQEYGSYSDLSSSPETSPSCSSLDYCYNTSPSISCCSSPALPQLQDYHITVHAEAPLDKSINHGLEITTKKGVQEFIKCITLYTLLLCFHIMFPWY